MPGKLSIKTALIFYGILIIISNFWFSFSKLEFVFSKNIFKDALISLIVAFIIIFASYICTNFTNYFNELKKIFTDFLSHLNLLGIIILALASGIGEEMLFRGVIQSYAGLYATSIIFGLFHIGPSLKFVPWTIFAIIMGFILGALKIYTGGLFAPILVHTIVNLVNMIMIKKAQRTKHK